MLPRRSSAWVRLLCAVALGLGLAGGSVAVAASTAAPHARSAITQLQGTVHDATATTARAPLTLSHHGGRHLPPGIGVALLAAAVLVGTRFVTTRRRLRSAGGDGRRTSPVGARAPPVAIGI